jgi:hypothetical protein
VAVLLHSVTVKYVRICVHATPIFQRTKDEGVTGIVISSYWYGIIVSSQFHSKGSKPPRGPTYNRATGMLPFPSVLLIIRTTMRPITRAIIRPL